jgi:uncharacterized membrane protein
LENKSSAFKLKLDIQGLSNLIFGLALSIGALTLVGQPPRSFEQLLASLGFYGFSFMVLVSVWRNYSSVMSELSAETERLVDLNVLLLFLVSIEPYLFNMLFATAGSLWDNVSIVFGLDFAAMYLILAFFNHSIVRKKNQNAAYLKIFQADRNYDLLIAVVFVISAVPLFGAISLFEVSVGNSVYNLPVRPFIWIAALVLGLLWRLIKAVKPSK